MNVLRSFFVGCSLLTLVSCGPASSVERATDYERERRATLQDEPKQPSELFDTLDREVETVTPTHDSPTFADNAPDQMDEEERELLKEQEATRARHEALEKARNEDEAVRQQKREAIERAADSFEQQQTSNEERQTNGGFIDDSNRTSVPVDPNAPTSFERCDDLKQYYPEGVPEGHPAYQPKLDRDQDGWACEPPGR